MIIKAVLVSFLLALATTLPGGAWAAASAAGVQSGPALRVVIQISENDQARWNLALNNIRNVQKELGADKIEIEVVAFGPGLGLLRDDSLAASRVREAMASGAHFIACRNTMQAEHISPGEMLEGIGYVQAGVVEIIRKQLEGYAYLRP